MGSGGGSATRLHISRVQEKDEHFLRKGIVQSTEKAYLSAQRGYLLFCQWLNLQPLLATEDTLILYVIESAQTRAHSTIKTYLAGVCNLHVINGLANLLEGKLNPNLVLKGINRSSQSTPQQPTPASHPMHHEHHQENTGGPAVLQQHHTMGSLLCGVSWLPVMWAVHNPFSQCLPQQETPHSYRRVSRQPYQPNCDHHQTKGHENCIGSNIKHHLSCECSTAVPSYKTTLGWPILHPPQGTLLTKATFIVKVREVLGQAEIEASSTRNIPSE